MVRASSGGWCGLPNQKQWIHISLLRCVALRCVALRCIAWIATTAHKLIRADPRNNSSWNGRWFASHRARREPLPLDICRQEADLALEGAKLDPYNESPFRYLIAILREQKYQLVELATEYFPKVEALRSVLVDANRDPEACVNWTSAKIDLLEAMSNENSWTKAVALAEGMANQYDLIRTKYWALRVRQLKEKLGTSTST